MIKVYVASAFCKDETGGNKAGVVLYENGLTNDEKKKIAKIVGYAETAFVTETPEADFKIEYFTPAEEVPLCGHATIATFGVLKYLNNLDKDSYTIETKSGNLNINLKENQIFMEQNIPVFYEELSYKEIKNSFDIDCINKNIPIQIVSTGLKDILIPIKNEEVLWQLKPNFEYITEISKKYNVVGMHLYTFSNDKVMCRNFAPLYDVNEESATGTSNCALAGLLFKKLNIKKDIYSFEQGYSLKAPSQIIVKVISYDKENIDKIFVGGNSKFLKIMDINLSENNNSK